MPPLASTFPDPRFLVVGCLILILLPIVGVLSVWLQLKSFLRGDRLSFISLAVILLFSAAAGFMVFVELQHWNWQTMGGYSRFLFGLSVCNLAPLPLTLTREVRKFVRDRQPHRRRTRRTVLDE
jgi:hypothetical protein